jgi:4-amino-4-deoxy-L-arabinose transferase-like glycosyltransferase
MRLSASPILRDRKLVAAFFILVSANVLIGNATTSVWDQDEAAYAGFARRMLTQHDWVVPEFPYSQPHRKVPLTFWMIAGSYALFGINEFALRLPSVLGLLTTIGCVWYGARFLLGTDTARLAAMILACSPFVLNLGKLALTDSVLLAFQTIAALALLRGVVRPSWQATVVLWTSVAGGVLTTGPPILILVGGMFLFLLVFYPRRRNLVFLHPWLGLPLALLPLAIWVWLAWQEDQRFVLFLAYWYVLRRAGGTVFGQWGPPGFYFLLFFVCLIPWTAYVWPALTDAWRGVRRRRVRFLLLGSWLFGGWIVWELLPSKLPTYTLGAFPALALLVARQVYLHTAAGAAPGTDRALRFGFRLLVGACVLVAGMVFSAGVWLGAPWCKVLAIVPAAVIVGVGLLALRFHRRAAPVAAAKTLMLGALAVNLLLWLVIVPGIEPGRAVTRRIAEALAARCVPETTVVAAKRMSLPSLPFYVEQAGLRFHEAVPREDPGPPVVDWSLLWRLKLRELVRQVETQKPAELSAEDDRTLRLERVAALYRSGHPFAFILDEEQYAALRDQWTGATPIRFEGWWLDRFAETTYVVVIPPAAGKARTVAGH